MSRLIPLWLVLVALVAMIGCARTDEAALDGDFGRCFPSELPLEAEHPTPAGYSAGDVADAIDGERRTTFAYADDTRTGLVIEILPGEGRWRDEVYIPEGEEVPAVDGCEDRLEIDATLVLVTDDGVFDEVFDVIVVATAAGVGRIDHVVPGDALEGGFADADGGSLVIAIEVSAETIAGELAVSFETDESTDADEGAEADVGRFPAS